MTPEPVRFERYDRPALDPPVLSGDEAHIWSVDLRAAPGHISAFGGLLSADERRRAARFRFDRHRRRFIVAQGALRTLLGRYCSTTPKRLVFEYGPKGKPSLVGTPDLHFNVSHSSERAVFGVSRRGPLGIDIELLRDLADADDIAERFFSAPEVESYRRIPGNGRQRAFFNCWTRKEAFVKALGEGLFLSLDRFDVSLAPRDAPRVLAIEGDSQLGREWSLTALDLGDDFAGALATRWRPNPIKAWDIDSSLLAPGAGGGTQGCGRVSP